MMLAFSGKAGSGKSAATDYLAKKYTLACVALADPLKRVAKDIYQFTDDQLWGPSASRNAPDPRYPRAKCKGCQTCEFRADHWYCLTPRYALQQLGTQWGRDCYGDTWIDYAVRVSKELMEGRVLPPAGRGGTFSKLRLAGGRTYAYYTPQLGLKYFEAAPMTDPVYRGVLFTDIRFRNEVDGLRERGVKLVRIKRPDTGLQGAAGMHVSETEQDTIDDDDFDVVINNDSTLADFYNKVDDAYRSLKGST